MTQQLVVIAVDDPMKAQEMLMAAARRAKDGKLRIDDAVAISKTDDETHELETTNMTPVEGGLGGVFSDLLFGTLLTGPVDSLVTGGALLAKIIDKGISDDFIWSNLPPELASEIKTAMAEGADHTIPLAGTTCTGEAPAPE